MTVSLMHNFRLIAIPLLDLIVIEMKRLYLLSEMVNSLDPTEDMQKYLVLLYLSH